MIVEILVTTDCPNEDAAIHLVGVAASALKMTPKVMLVEVTDLSEARQQRFPGSPTIRIDGRDVSPPSGAEASLSCRTTYATSHGPSGVPEFRLLIAALGRATGRGGQSD
jgi:hypothetical protein